MQLYRTTKGHLLQRDGNYFLIGGGWDELINREGLHAYLKEIVPGKQGDATRSNLCREISKEQAAAWVEQELCAPIGSQEVWAAGVTYLRSREARMEESKDSGGADFYDKVYMAERPELFFKSLPHRVAANGEAVFIRRDSTWNVPEPELTLFINKKGQIQGYTIGNDMSSRSIEGENPLYLPQAKMYERSAALGPCLYIPESPISPDTRIQMTISRSGSAVYSDEVAISRMKRSLTELAGWLYRELDFPNGSFLMTGTCLVPPNAFTLQENDIVQIQISGIGTLANRVSYKPLVG